MFEAEAKKIGKVDYLVQGTIYPDVIESGAGDAAVIKSHHNVGGLPEHVEFLKKLLNRFVICLRMKCVSLVLNLVCLKNSYGRQPFPGPGLAVEL